MTKAMWTYDELCRVEAAHSDAMAASLRLAEAMRVDGGHGARRRVNDAKAGLEKAIAQLAGVRL